MSIESIALFLFPSLISLLTLVVRISMRSFIGFYAIFSSLLMMYVYYFFGFKESLLSFSISLLALVSVLFLLTGFFGKKISLSFYKGLIVGLGTFPWWVDFKISFVYAGFLSVFILVDFLFRSGRFTQLSYLLMRLGLREDLIKDQDVYDPLIQIPVAIGSIISAAYLIFQSSIFL